MAKSSLILSILLPFFGFSQNGNIKAEIKCVNWKDTIISGELLFNDFNCHNNANIYLQLVNPNSEILEEKIFRVQTNIGSIPFSFQYSGSELCLAMVATSGSGEQGNPIAFNHVVRSDYTISSHYGNPPGSNIKIIPEGGVLLKNYYSRVAVKHNGAFTNDKNNSLFVINGAGKVVAVAPFNQQGVAFADIPFIENDILVFQDKQGNVLETIEVNDDGLLKDNGFSLRVQSHKDYLEVDMRRGYAEGRDAVYLFVRFQDKILYEAEARFKKDTNVVATHIPMEGLANKLLTFELFDKENNLLSRRLSYYPDPQSNNHPLNGLCGFILGTLILSASLSPDSISDYLIMAKKSEEESTQNTKAGFQLGFHSKELANKKLNYHITGSKGGILKIGNVDVGKEGNFMIDELDFPGKAEVTFFIDKKEVISEIISVPVRFSSSVQDFLEDTLNALSKIILPIETAGKQKEDSLKVGFESSLKNVEVVGRSKTRTEELEEKYISNIRFKDMNAISLDLENDPYVANFDIYDYLVRKIPGLSVKKSPNDPKQRIFTYRQGVVDVYLDEAFIGMASDLPFFNLYDIGYIRFNKQAVNSLRTAAGGAAAQGRSLVAGVTASVLIYTKKFSEAKTVSGVYKLPIMGYVN